MKEVCGFKMFSPAEVQKMLGVGKNKLYELLKSRQIEYVDLNGKWFITEQAIRAGIERMTLRRGSPKLYPKS